MQRKNVDEGSPATFDPHAPFENEDDDEYPRKPGAFLGAT